MRNQGIYIIDSRLKFREGLQRKFLVNVKKSSGQSWVWLANKINVSRYTLSSTWYSEESTLPKSKAKELLGLGRFEHWEVVLKDWVLEELPPKWGQIKSGTISLKPINRPANSESLAEFVGVVIGDGHISDKGVRITGNLFEIKHHKYIQKLIKELFDLDARVFTSRTHETVCLTDIYSKNLLLFLENMGLGNGDKIKNKTRIPNWIFGNKNFIYGALRGLFDTDGGIYSKQKKYKRAFIEFQNHCPETLKDIKLLIEKVGFTPSKSSINVRIQDQEEVKRFFSLVGSSNPKNIIRFQEFLNSGEIPLKENLNNKIVRYNGPQPFKTQS